MGLVGVDPPEPSAALSFCTANWTAALSEEDPEYPR